MTKKQSGCFFWNTMYTRVHGPCSQALWNCLSRQPRSNASVRLALELCIQDAKNKIRGEEITNIERWWLIRVTWSNYFPWTANDQLQLIRTDSMMLFERWRGNRAWHLRSELCHRFFVVLNNHRGHHLLGTILWYRLVIGTFANYYGEVVSFQETSLPRSFTVPSPSGLLWDFRPSDLFMLLSLENAPATALQATNSRELLASISK